MGGFTIAPGIFKCFKKRDETTSRTSSNSSLSSHNTTSNSLASKLSTSSQQKLVKSQKPKAKKVYNTSPFTGPTAFSANSGYSARQLAAIQPYRFAGR